LRSQTMTKGGRKIAVVRCALHCHGRGNVTVGEALAGFDPQSE
jgi:hypothetical protein